ncbi:MAG: 1-deoxy-D-xylulose-5-phosphate reductoisomerase [Calditerrivibrio sp.]|nr:1-deoxy-D-xylulose-5-phosphate reductoisomerase [Calditerrivibrio sp.]
MKKIGIVGSTGSIGTQALDVIRRHRKGFKVVFLTCNFNTDLLMKQVEEFEPNYAISMTNPVSHPYVQCRFLCGVDNLIKIIKEEDLDIVLIATTGFSGVLPALEAVKRGLRVALANKESIVVAGDIITRTAKATGSEIIPVDSEHSAIFQCLMGQDKSKVEKVILTASGGPFRNRPYDSIEYVRKEEALRHPNWSMGAKITIDSATMMNKGLELIEAKYLFDLSPHQLDVIIHPQSIIHSMVMFVDGSYLAQMGNPDMRTPISFALGYPHRIESGVKGIDFQKFSSLTFLKVDYRKYRCLELAINILNINKNSLMIVMNAANEVAVDAFLKDKIGFSNIYDVIHETLSRFTEKDILEIDEIFELDILSREAAKEIVHKL